MNRFSVPRLDLAKLVGQESAFIECRKFLKGIGKTQRMTSWYPSYELKQIVEDPWCSSPHTLSTPCGHIEEGTLVLAALSLGFRMAPSRGSGTINVCFNINESDLKRRMQEVANLRAKRRAALTWDCLIRRPILRTCPRCRSRSFHLGSFAGNRLVIVCSQCKHPWKGRVSAADREENITIIVSRM